MLVTAGAAASPAVRAVIIRAGGGFPGTGSARARWRITAARYHRGGTALLITARSRGGPTSTRPGRERRVRTADPASSRPPAGRTADRAPAGRWLIDAHLSTLSVAVKLGRLLTVAGTFADVCGTVQITDEPVDSRVEVAVGTASLSSGSSRMDAVMHGAGIVDAVRNPTIDFLSGGLRPAAAGCWLLDGLLATRSALLDVTLTMPDPVLADDRLTCRATGVLPSREAVRLLSQPGLERMLGPTMRLDLTLVAARD